MNRISLICFALLLGLASSAQSNPVDAPVVRRESDSTAVFTTVEIESKFPGGAKAWQAYLGANFQYPKGAIKKNIQGTVIVQFIVRTDGSVTDVEVVQSVHPSLDREALRLIKESPNWIPAKQNGRKVNSYKKQPVVFKLVG